MRNLFYIRIIGSLVLLVLLSFWVSGLLITGFSYTLAAVGLVVILLIGMFIIRLINRSNNQLAFFFEAIRHNDFTNRYPVVTTDPLLNDLYREMDRITILFSEKESVNKENRIYYESLLQVMAHEIRNAVTPVTTLASEMGQQYELYTEDEIREGLAIIESQGKILLALLDAYHRMTHLPEPQKIAIKTGTLFDRLKQLLTGEAGQLCVCYEQTGDPDLFVDPNLLLLGLLNLVCNALQAIEGKENGWVKVIAEKQRSAPVIRIIDNGTGIPRELQTVIFTPFYSTKKEGNGIGLSIAHRIVRLHQGELQVSSIPDVQTCFSLHLPLYEHKE
ncbi:MAG: HAMP domain-containing histidine kinase [Tannerellaceae bacterium]|nr:HAMP domain-containing histidine kinase [Tannerellaceae bacterium]